MTEIETLLAIEQIKQLKARYFRCVDTKDWNGYHSVFAEDLHFDIGSELPDGDNLVIGADNAVNIARRSLIATLVSVHHGHCPEIEITSETTANGIWVMEDMLKWMSGSDYPGQTLHGYGHYFETYEKSGDKWRIKTLKLSRLRRDIYQES